MYALKENYQCLVQVQLLMIGALATNAFILHLDKHWFLIGFRKKECER